MDNIVAVSESSSSESAFEQIRRRDNLGREYWQARELMELLGYTKWENFSKTIKKAKLACANTQNPVTEHFFLMSGNKPSSAGRVAEDYQLSRFGSYLVAMNGDPSKSEIAAAQSYFAIATQKAESDRSTQSPVDQIKAASKVFDFIFANTGIQPAIVAGLKINIAIEAMPELRSHFEASRQLLINDTAQPHALLTPTEIGNRYEKSALDNPCNKSVSLKLETLSSYEIFLLLVEKLRINYSKLPKALYIYLGAVLNSLADPIYNNCSEGELLIPSDKIYPEADESKTLNLINQIFKDNTHLTISLTSIEGEGLDWIAFKWGEGEANLFWLPGKSLMHENGNSPCPEDLSKMFLVSLDSPKDSALQSVADRLKKLHRTSDNSHRQTA